MFKNKLLLLQNTFENRTKTPVRHVGTGVIPGNSKYGSVGLGVENTLLSQGKLSHDSSSELNVSVDNNFGGGCNIDFTTSVSMTNALSAFGNRDLGGKTGLDLQLQQFTIPSLTIDGNNSNNIDIDGVFDGSLLGQILAKANMAAIINATLNGTLDLSGKNTLSNVYSIDLAGVTGSNQVGNTLLSSIISLLCQGNINSAPSVNMTNDIQTGFTPGVDFSGRVSLSNTHNISSGGVLDIGGALNKILVIDLNSDGSTFANVFGSTDLSLIHSIAADGNIVFNNGSNLSINCDNNCFGNVELAGSLVLLDTIDLNNVNLNSASLNNLVALRSNLSLIANLSKTMEDLPQYKFDLCIVQREDFSLIIQQQKGFSLIL